jgi:CDP-glucose 4,6-dehydratase
LLNLDIDSHIQDIRDISGLKRITEITKPEIIFHLAAQPIVRLSYEKPHETYETNVMGTINLLEVVRTNPSIKAVVVVTSDKCYDNKEWDWGYRENEAMGGKDPYSCSKDVQVNRCIISTLLFLRW